MIKLKDLKGQKWVIGVSGGSDSMALLFKSIQAGLDTFVVHVNYQKRETAIRDEHLVRTFCEEHHIPYIVVLYDKKEEGNFQARARDFRYDIFEEYVKKIQAKGVLVAHHLDDVLETYLMQKQRNAIPYTYGLSERVILKGLQVVRPLLDYEKKELISYCEEHRIPYEDDESNFSDAYTRNKIRHHQVELMSHQEKLEMLQVITQENKVLLKRRQEAMKFLVKWDGSIKTLCEQEDILFILYIWIYKDSQVRLTTKQLEEMLRLLENHEGSWSKDIGSTHVCSYEYGYLYCFKKEEISYTYVISQLEEMTTPYFKFKNEGTAIQGFTVKEEDFPLTIRNVIQGDKIHLRLGTKKIHRWFIDRKIPKIQRRSWPVVLNKDGEIIFVPRIGCDIEHYSINPTIFMIKC